MQGGITGFPPCQIQGLVGQGETVFDAGYQVGTLCSRDRALSISDMLQRVKEGTNFSMDSRAGLFHEVMDGAVRWRGISRRDLTSSKREESEDGKGYEVSNHEPHS